VPYPAFKRKLTASYFVPSLIALGALAIIVLWRIQNQASINNWVQHSYRVMMQAKDAQINVRGLQAAYRGYLVSSSPQYLNEITDERRQLGENLGALSTLVADNPEQERILVKVNEVKEAWIDELERLLARKDTGQISSERSVQMTPSSRAVFAALGQFIDGEQQLRAQRVAREQAQYDVLFLLIPLLSLAAMIALSYWGWRQIVRATDEFHAALDTAEQAKAEAERAGERAEKANRAKDNFLGTISHELRNPLNSILLWSTALLRDETLAEAPRRGITAIERAVRVQSQLIEDLLDISRIESGRIRLDVQTVDLAEVVKAGVEGMRAAADAKSIELQEILDSRVDFIAGDPARLQQIVWNLVSNAVKFTPKGGKIQIRLERINSHVEIIIADNGRGIESASLGSVFERFWQGTDTGQARNGVGLGLSIVKELVGLHGGTVVAHSDGPGAGSTFTVRLPLPASVGRSVELRRHPTAQRDGVGSATRLDGLSILVIDDDPDTCDALRNLLQSLGATATTALSARAALAILDALHPDAVVSDIGMPVEDGYFLARELRKRERDAGKDGVPLVALTAYGRVEDKVQILTAGFDSHAIKPVDPVELSAILRTCITSRRGTRASNEAG
jgi:signal transduction histidine kinase/ActR/RegA family two-component response regulator